VVDLEDENAEDVFVEKPQPKLLDVIDVDAFQVVMEPTTAGDAACNVDKNHDGESQQPKDAKSEDTVGSKKRGRPRKNVTNLVPKSPVTKSRDKSPKTRLNANNNKPLSTTLQPIKIAEVASDASDDSDSYSQTENHPEWTPSSSRPKKHINSKSPGPSTVKTKKKKQKTTTTEVATPSTPSRVVLKLNTGSPEKNKPSAREVQQLATSQLGGDLQKPQDPAVEPVATAKSGVDGLDHVVQTGRRLMIESVHSILTGVADQVDREYLSDDAVFVALESMRVSRGDFLSVLNQFIDRDGRLPRSRFRDFITELCQIPYKS